MKPPPKILINCSNLHHGGGVAVATSFLASLCRSHRTEYVSVLVSSLVHHNLLALGVRENQFESYLVRDYVGLESLWKGLDNYFVGYQIVFTVFGPAYFLRKRTQHIVGLAQPYIAYPTNAFEKTLPLLRRVKLRLKSFVQSLFFVRADALIVELDCIKTSLLTRSVFKSMPIYVVSSAVDEIYTDSTRWKSVAMPIKKDRLRLGVISKNYPHKNLCCLPEVKDILIKKFGVVTDFFVTFTDEEWVKCDSFFRESITNIGPLTLAQCPHFYHALDGVVFPSLLECFSAVPLETMLMKKPLFASNLPFMVDCCQQHANYIDPIDPEHIAQAIYTYFQQNKAVQIQWLNDAYSFAKSHPDAHARADKYNEIILRKMSVI